MRSVACDDPDPSWIVVCRLVETVLAQRGGRVGDDRLGLQCAQPAHESVDGGEVGAGFGRQGHVPLAIGLAELQDACRRGDGEGVDLVALHFQGRLVTQVECRLVERGIDEAGYQEDAFLIAELGVEVGRRGRFAANLKAMLRAADLERNFQTGLRQPVLREVRRILFDDPLELERRQVAREPRDRRAIWLRRRRARRSATPCRSS